MARARRRTTRTTHQLTVVDALKKAAKNPKFAVDFAAHPSKYKAKYHLTPKQIAKIRKVAKSGAAGASYKRFV